MTLLAAARHCTTTQEMSTISSGNSRLNDLNADSAVATE